MKWSKLFLPVMVVSMIVGMSSCGKDDGSSSVPQRPSAEIKPIQLPLPEYNGRNGKFRQE